jgi:hypothetical protein
MSRYNATSSFRSGRMFGLMTSISRHHVSEQQVHTRCRVEPCCISERKRLQVHDHRARRVSVIGLTCRQLAMLERIIVRAVLVSDLLKT